MEKGDLQIGRPPIVVVLGHVDHGKTTLLDTIRKTNVTAKEAGGITQSIGASKITFTSASGENKSIVFIDTPGHAAFTKMRGRGAKVADIAILVVAQDDGVQPQTKEALEIIKAAGIPFIVAGTKADVAGTNPEVLKGQLEKESVFFEGRGGDIPFISVSAKTNIGLSELLEMITLMADVAELKGDPKGSLEAVVIESGRDKMGTVATVVLRNGNVKVGDIIFAEKVECKVRALFDDKGKSIKEVSPGNPAKVFGFSVVPTVGASITSEPHEAKKEEIKVKGVFDLRRLKDDEIPIIIKADNAGSLEAIIASLPPKIVVVGSGVGDVTSSDIIDAKTGNAYVFAFESKIPADITKLAEAEKVKVERFQIIYELLQKLDEILKKGMVEITGHAQVLAIFPFNNQKVAGCKVVDGRISKGDTLILQRSEKEIGKSRVKSIRKQKLEVSSVGPSEEFGAILDPQLDFQIGDMLLSVAK
ncbi:MAG: translation initiation factor IF-2, translation initiation factor IF-2 [Microgenomates group bacterium GW2011_GWC1_41_20]|uniref:Translation initiation factor IF-2 n=1 Tax=Candidatus Woesebacteria bacterium GW2011_GWE1_41_24 TaxID=1618597 RepID=A0A0G0Y8K4_9BACT|nr:MAG: translation initiation factor IF-2, translation initiation factor IF-2 [Microgenomates group bacterium GW2011_GWC1_41_20]KKS05816.1 MAG: Translation initiation factor IF-2 [Candidatus Woesebacteria bacterium GW2011_GWE1_41_24]